uniref:Uncharacterized protein n=1 Tax=Triticum urartu TaxID=4572 RepID=A0A8R7Q9L5_TRIUA
MVQIPLQLKYFFKKAQVPINLTCQIMEKALAKKVLDNSHGNQYSTSYCGCFIWSCYVLFLNSIILNKVGGLPEMFEKTYGFILIVKDLSPNIGVLWYFFAEVFFFREASFL